MSQPTMIPKMLKIEEEEEEEEEGEGEGEEGKKEEEEEEEEKERHLTTLTTSSRDNRYNPTMTLTKAPKMPDKLPHTTNQKSEASLFVRSSTAPHKIYLNARITNYFLEIPRLKTLWFISAHARVVLTPVRLYDGLI